MKTLNCKLLVVSAAILLWFCQTGLSAISVGGRVSVTQNGVNVRAGAGSTTVNGQQNSGALGAVTGGPTNAQIGGTGTTYTWWNVNFDSGADGWVASINLAEVAAPTMTLGSPNAGATWQVGTSQTVNWSVNGDTNAISYFVVRLSTNNGSSYTDISSNLGSSTRSFSYSPTSSQATTTAVCWVRGFNAGGTVVAAAISSGAFTISIPVPTMSLSSPNAGATWQVGTSQTVDWSVSGDTSQISFFVVKLSTDNSNSYTDISSNLSASTRSFSYTPTGFQATTTAVCWVRAFNSGGTVVAAAISSGPFTIAAPTVTLSNPNAGATWQVGTNQTVGWSVSGNTNQISYFVVRLSTDNSNSYTDISSNLIATTRSFSYTPTSGQATTTAVCWVRAFNSNGTFLAGAISSGPFTITNPTPAFSITTTAFNPATATVGTGYAAQVAVTATGGQTPYSWSASGLPNGMSINSSTGAPFGTPTVAGTFNVNVTVTDSSGPQKTTSKTLTLTVNSAANSPGPFTLSNRSPYWDPNAPAGPAVRLNWTASSGAVNYDVYRNGILYSSNVAGTTFLNNLGLSGAQTYSYYVVAKNSYGIRQSNTVQITMPTASTSATISSLTITGTSSIAAGTSANYTATAVYSDGTQQNVTNGATFGFAVTPGAGVGIGGATLFVSAEAPTQTVYLRASYGNGASGTTSAPLAVNVQRPFSATASGTSVYQSGTNYTVTLSGNVSGGTSPFTFRWDTNGNGIYGDVIGSNVSYTATNQGFPASIKLEVTDGVGVKAYASTKVALEKPPVANEPRVFKPSFYLGTSVLKDPDSLDGNFVASKGAKGLIILTHGMRDDWNQPDSARQGQTWLPHMAQHIRSRIPSADQPNILIYGWGADSDPAAYPTEAVARAKQQLDALGFVAALVGVDIKTWKLDLLASVTGWLSDLAVDCWYVRNSQYVPMHGLELADLITNAEKQGLVSKSAPIHFIGHSAGGFVMGQCGMLLRQRGFNVSLVTMLDTPFPMVEHLTPPRCARMVDRYISSFYGTLDLPSAAKLQPDVDYFYGLTSNWSPLAFTFFNHGASHEWYSDQTVDAPNAVSGFRFSPFSPNSLYPFPSSAPALAAFGGNQALAVESAVAAGTTEQALGGFQTFGQVTEAGGVYTLTESSHAGIFGEKAFPVGIVSVKFQCWFSTAGDGDQLTVYAGDEPIYTVLDLPIVRDGFLEFEASVYGLDGLTDTLTFKLVSRGAANAVVQVKDIRFVVSDDPDDDGLTTTQEQAKGTNPLLSDTDGDGWSDGYEANSSHTNPLLKDTDGDGVSDTLEALGGTDPNDNTSSFASKDIKRETDGSMTIRWSGQPNKTYRVLRSATPGFESFDVITTKITGISPLTSYTDPAANLQAVPTAFYRIEVE